ncbi:hypothetical protein [Acetobacter oeni]|uniref:Uncharacterized protein n=1 Tax=Acetobacter oeni TaxID=304077 RepID=A0A511XNT6_9PROT|nr:hypothetical protein [Acetobacter oeni]MBB3881632.1 hypothetical protein [Acetobacter oeni]NHO17558.1 hypothetical protein [Acetobacter oeni]GBR00969.1 hypothetical protein AA21952_0273 [Acetobacter oeni LMG 21952]GEN64613.1 hypothetical protein AOE01nite_28370 [Acetobacter oeni]
MQNSPVAPSFQTIFESDLNCALHPGLEKEAPHTRHTLDFLTDRQRTSPDSYTHLPEATLRWFQRDIASDGSFLIPSPYTGEMIRSGDSIVTAQRKVFFRFPSEPRVLLAQANLGRGYPIVALVLLDLGFVLQLEERIWGIQVEDVLRYLEVVRAKNLETPQPARAIQLLTGDENFAHHLWNQLGALLELATIRKGREDVSLFFTHQSLGPLKALCPTIQSWPTEWIDIGELETLNRAGTVTFCPGGMLVTPEAKKAVRKVAETSQSAPIRKLISSLSGKHPIIWVSIRTSSRTATNQTEFLRAFCDAIFRKHRKAVILLDGVSYPHDFRSNPNYRVSGIEKTERNDQEFIGTFLKSYATSPVRPGKKSVFPACGLDILDSISLVHEADFYVCHHGTVQHKIGWTTDCPGVVQTNRRVIAIHPGRWVALQAGLQKEPFYIDENLIEDITIPESEQSAEDASRKFDSYRITDIPKMVDVIISQMDAVIPPTKKSGFSLFGCNIRLPSLLKR